MKVYLAPPAHLSQGIQRVARALEHYRPDWVELTRTPEEADLRVGHVVGLLGVPEWCAVGPYALIQYCLKTAEEHLSGNGFDPKSNPGVWLPIWNNAKAVWSYYDLISYIKESRPGAEFTGTFYHAPLGVDGGAFIPSVPVRKRYVIGTSGYVAESECVGECAEAATLVNRPMFHLGPPLDVKGNVCYVSGCTDYDLAEFWSQCSYVAGLRRFEGFELPALEGLACGSRPVMLDAPHYRQWFGEHAEYIKEGTYEEVRDALVELFSRPVRVVTAVERNHVVDKFNWKPLAEGFWEALR